MCLAENILRKMQYRGKTKTASGLFMPECLIHRLTQSQIHINGFMLFVESVVNIVQVERSIK